MAELSVYIHIPFCERKCQYCAFTSYVADEHAKKFYIEKLEQELAFWNIKLGGIKAKTLYIGGGTPSCLSFTDWELLRDTIKKFIDLSDCMEFTVEANPNSLDDDLLYLWRKFHVTRVSLGVQSFNDEELKFLGRLHDARQAMDAIELVKESGQNLNADFMFGLPGQSLESWKDTIKKAVDMNFSHVSLYQLSVEENTPFAKMNLDLPEGYEQYMFACEYLEQSGFKQYEIANFAKYDRQCKHNLNYWCGGDYLGVGIAASGYLAGVRYTNESKFQPYANLLECKGNAVVFTEKLEGEARAREASVLQLRMNEGITREKFRTEYGEAAEKFVLDTLAKFPNNLYKVTDDRIALTLDGMCVANRIWSELV